MLWGLVVVAGAMVGAEPLPKAEVAALADRTLVIGHRGASADAPENTLPAFRLAIDAQADLVELDYYHSADGVPVAFHDKTLDRTSNAVELFGEKKLRPEQLRLEQLRQLDVGSWFDPKFAGARMPTLEESLDEILPGSVPLIERKGGDAATCIELLRQKQIVSNVVVQAFDWNYLADCHRLEPNLLLGALGSGKLTDAKLARIEKTGAKVVGWSYKDITEADVARVHERGWKLWTYTVNDPAVARRLIDWGVDGIITDVPARMHDLVSDE